MDAFVNLIPTLGFPIVCVIALAAFVFLIYKNTTKEHKETILQVQQESRERENRLFDEIAQNREVNAQAIATIALYAERLDVIQRDINEIKEDVLIIAEKVDN